MRIGEFETFLEKALPLRKRILAVGKPGVGKTYAYLAAAKRLGWDTILMCSALEDPSTVRGYPSRGSNGMAEHCLFDGTARAFAATKPTLWLWDDLGMSSEATMRSIVRLFQFGEIDQRRLPDCVHLAAASNDVGHGPGVYGMIEPLKTRFHTILNVETNVDDVVQWGLSKAWPSDLCAYLRNSPAAVHDWKPSKSMAVDGASPRGWESVADWIRVGIDNREVLGGAVGPGRALEYLAFRQIINELPDLDGVLLDPDGAPVPENPSARFLICCGLSARMNGRNFGQCLRYLARLPQMMRAFSIRDAARAENLRRRDGTLPEGYAAFHSSEDFAAWSVSQDGKDVIMAGRDS
jgi:hypothetical protein